MHQIILVRHRRSPAESSVFLQAMTTQLRERGYQVRTTTGSMFFLLRAVFLSCDILDLHDQRLFLFGRIYRLFRPVTTLIATLHERPEFSPQTRRLSRVNARLGLRIALRVANEIVTTRKALQYTLLRQFGILATHIPYGTDASTQLRTRPRRQRRFEIAILTTQGKAGIRSLRLSLPRKRSVSVHVRHVRHAPDGTLPPREAATLRAIVVPTSFPLPALRTLASSGVPVIAFDTPDHRELLGSESLYLSTQRRSELIHALTNLLSRPRFWQRHARMLQRRTLNLYTWTAIADDLLRVYHRPTLERVSVDSLTPRLSENG